jgi:adenosine deaminase CECR1
VRFSECASSCPSPLLEFHTVLDSTWSALPPCCRSEYEPLSELDANRKAAWITAMRIDGEGEGCEELGPLAEAREVIDQAGLLVEAAVENQKLLAHENVSYVEFQLSPFGRREGERVLPPDEFHRLLAERLARDDARETGVTVRLQANVVRFLPDAEKRVEESWAFVDRHRHLWVSVNLVGREDNDKTPCDSSRRSGR